MGPNLAEQYPTIDTFTFDGVANTKISGRMTLAGDSFQAILRPPDDFARIAPLITPAGTFHLAFLNRNRTDGADQFRFFHDTRATHTTTILRCQPLLHCLLPSQRVSARVTTVW